MAITTPHQAGRAEAEPSGPLAIPQFRSDQPQFAQTMTDHGLAPLQAGGIHTLQLNLGRLCNMTCKHCHVDAGPQRREVMSRATAEACLMALAHSEIPTLDLTGGAPEMNPNFGLLVTEARRLGRHVIDRSNLTILTAAGFEDWPQFLAERQVEIVASLPCYFEQNVDAQRGATAFRRSVAALRRLNQLGYGQPSSGLTLTLVFNPLGPTLPPAQQSLEEAYRRELATQHGVTFSRLFTITNMPLGRFLEHLLRTGKFEKYMDTLLAAFNPAAAQGLMCRTTLSVDWQGRLYDCDFNQMLGLSIRRELPQNIREFDLRPLASRGIVTGQHCFGCTAGAGSSCQGAIAGPQRV